MERVVVTCPVLGFCAMQVCAVADATDEEILEVCNRENPSGTSAGWGSVIRSVLNLRGGERAAPIACATEPGRVHFLVEC